MDQPFLLLLQLRFRRYICIRTFFYPFSFRLCLRVQITDLFPEFGKLRFLPLFGFQEFLCFIHLPAGQIQFLLQSLDLLFRCLKLTLFVTHRLLCILPFSIGLTTLYGPFSPGQHILHGRKGSFLSCTFPKRRLCLAELFFRRIYCPDMLDLLLQLAAGPAEFPDPVTLLLLLRRSFPNLLRRHHRIVLHLFFQLHLLLIQRLPLIPQVFPHLLIMSGTADPGKDRCLLIVIAGKKLAEFSLRDQNGTDKLIIVQSDDLLRFLRIFFHILL